MPASSTTPLTDTDLTSHFICKLLRLRSNLLRKNRHVTCKIRHDFQSLAPLLHSTDAYLVLTTQQTLTVLCLLPQKNVQKQFAGFYYGIFPYILWHLLPRKKAPCAETTIVCPSATHSRWLHRPSIFVECCVGFMCYKCRECVGLVQISSVSHILVKGIKEFPPVLSIFVVICGCDSLQEKHKRSQSQRSTVYFV
jgi:hypothetical protein